MTNSFAKASRGVTFRLSLPCDFTEVRPAALSVRKFLAEQGLHEAELAECELALVEACNNAVQYASQQERRQAVEISAMCSASKVELRVNDHTRGFDWPKRAVLPILESEGGRGLYLIQSLMDGADYLRGKGENTLVMRKARRHLVHRNGALPASSLEEANQRVAEYEHTIREMVKEMSFCHESLSAIFRCSAELGRTNDLGDFSQRLLNDLLHISSTDWFLLRLVANEGTCLTTFAASHPDLQLQPLSIYSPQTQAASAEIDAALSRDAVRFDARQSDEVADPLHAVRPDSMGLVQPLFWGDALIGTLAVGKGATQCPFTASQAAVVRTFAEFLALEFVNAQLQEEQVSTRLVAHELEIARNIQRALLPKSLPKLQGFSMAASSESAHQVGGDFYDVLPMSANALLLVVADVMGKGVPAAMFATSLRNLVRAMPEWARQPAELLARVNRQMYEELSGVEMFITAQLMFVDVQKRELITASAGHCPALLVDEVDADVKSISPEGMPLGILPGPVFGSETVQLGRRCRLLLHTDGLSEARSTTGEEFGRQRLSDWLQHTLTRPGTAEDFRRELANELAAFQAGAALSDDQTFLILTEAGG